MRYQNYLLFLLTIICAFNYTDRFALGIAAQDIKADLALSDTQLGFLSGIAFAVFYALAGIPMARWADRGNRARIIAVSTALWSGAVAICGAAQTFAQLVLIRVVVGVGEAGCMPPSHSLIADFFSRAQRPRAVSVYMQGVAGGLILGYFVAGWLNQYFGWRMMFVLIGVPGLVLALISRLTLKEPRTERRGRIETISSAHNQTMKEVCVDLWSRATFRHVLIAFSWICFFGSGTQQWAPAYFVRRFGFQTGALGTWFAVIFGVTGVLGTYWAGEWAARTARENERRQLNGMALVTGLSGLFAIFAYIPSMSPNYYWAFGWLALSNGTSMMVNGPTFAVLQTLVPPHMRAMSVALVMFCVNLVGLGFGPWVAGALSDVLRPWAGNDSLRYGILLLCPAALWGAFHLWRAGQAVALDFRAGDAGRDMRRVSCRARAGARPEAYSELSDQ